MNEVQWNQIMGVLRASIPTLLMIATLWGIIDKATADSISPLLLEGLTAVGVIGTIIMSILSYLSNRPKAVAQQTANQPDVKVVVGPNAPTEVKELAKDLKVPDVELKKEEVK